MLTKSQRMSTLSSKLYKLSFLLLAFSLSFISQATTAKELESPDKITVRYPLVKTVTLYKESANYFLDVMKLALDKSDADYTLEFVEIQTMPLSRSMALIKQGVYDVHWLSTTVEREKQLNPVRVPLFKGLLGLRISLINSQKHNLLSKTLSLDELKRLYIGQGHDWPDTQVLKHHGFRVIPSSTTTALVDLVKRGRIDYFPRSVIEVWAEEAFINDPSVVVEQNVAIYYPQAFYFFVRNDNKILHHHIETGLQRAIEDGSFEANFNAYFLDYIHRAQLEKRALFRLHNPFIPPETPLDDKKLWLQIPLVKNP